MGTDLGTIKTGRFCSFPLATSDNELTHGDIFPPSILLKRVQNGRGLAWPGPEILGTPITIDFAMSDSASPWLSHRGTPIFHHSPRPLIACASHACPSRPAHRLFMDQHLHFR